LPFLFVNKRSVMCSQTFSPSECYDFKPWFVNLIDILKSRFSQQKNQLINIHKEESDIAFSHVVEDYSTAMHQSRIASQKFFTTQILKVYIDEIHSLTNMPDLIGLAIGHNEILVWCQINDDDDEMENNLFLAEAKANADQTNSGISISTTIVERSEIISIPSHYKLLLDNAVI
jgi:hypothetical protein